MRDSERRTIHEDAVVLLRCIRRYEKHLAENPAPGNGVAAFDGWDRPRFLMCRCAESLYRQLEEELSERFGFARTGDDRLATLRSASYLIAQTLHGLSHTNVGKEKPMCVEHFDPSTLACCLKPNDHGTLGPELNNEVMKGAVEVVRCFVEGKGPAKSKPRYKPPPCPRCGGRRTTASVPKGKGIRKLKCKECGYPETVSRDD